MFVVVEHTTQQLKAMHAMKPPHSAATSHNRTLQCKHVRGIENGFWQTSVWAWTETHKFTATAAKWN